MTTTRRRKAPTRSVAIRRVKPNAKRKERKTQKRKSRNKVMRGGAGDLLLYYEPGVNPQKCIIIKEKLTGRRDNLYLFFAADIKLDEVKSYVCKAMGLADSVKFEPKFEPKNSDNKSFKLNNLFVRLSGMLSYTTIESGYLQRGDDVKHKHLVTSTKHKITPELTSASEIKSWEVVVRDKLQFQQYKDFQYVELTSHVAENGYFYIGYEFRPAQETAEDACRKQIDTLMDKSDHNYIGRMKNKIMETTKSLKEQIRINKLTNKNNAVHAPELINFFKNNAEYSLDENITDLKSFYDRFKYRATINKVVLSPECLKVLESYLGLTGLKTIEEMVDEAYAGNSSEISSQP